MAQVQRCGSVFQAPRLHERLQRRVNAARNPTSPAQLQAGKDHGDDPGEILTQGSRHRVRRPVRLDLIVFHTAVGMTNELDAVAADGGRDAISREALAGLNPYQSEHINSSGDYILDLGQPPALLSFALPARSQPARQAAVFAEAVPV